MARDGRLKAVSVQSGSYPLRMSTPQNQIYILYPNFYKILYIVLIVSNETCGVFPKRPFCPYYFSLYSHILCLPECNLFSRNPQSFSICRQSLPSAVSHHSPVSGCIFFDRPLYLLPKSCLSPFLVLKSRIFRPDVPSPGKRWMSKI